MPKRLALPVLFIVLLSVATWRHLDASWHLLAPVVFAGGAAQPGTFPDQRINGTDCATEPKFQVHAYNDDLFIIRQSKCETFEAPFLFLLFGDERALLMDTGANPSSPVATVVKATIDQWLVSAGKSSIPLIVAHTHSHGDHVAGDSQFVGQPWVSQVVGLDQISVEQFWGFTNYPVDVPQIDLGNRVIDVLGTPGHQNQSVTLYDRRTELLLAGDIVYPGHLFVFAPNQFPVFINSLERLVEWAANHPVAWVVGCHIEYSSTPGQPFAWGTAAHPSEHPLQLAPEILFQVYRAARSMRHDPQCTIFDEFVIHPVYQCGITWNG